MRESPLPAIHPGSVSLKPARTRLSPEHDLLAEIAWFESRLREIGDIGDCAYDKALARSYLQAVDQRRERLAALRQTAPG